MHVSLTPALEQMIQEKVDSGMYSCASEVIREALRLLNKYETHLLKSDEEIRREVQVGLDEFERGDFVEGRTFMKNLIKDLESRQ